MEINHSNLRKILKSFDRAEVIAITCNRSINSICSLFIFTQILKADLFKYQIEFKEMDIEINLTFTGNNQEYILSNKTGSCTCKNREMGGVSILFRVAKSMDYLKVETIWPLAVCYSFYKEFSNEEEYLIEDKENKGDTDNKNSIYSNENESNRNKGSFDKKEIYGSSENKNGIYSEENESNKNKGNNSPIIKENESNKNNGSFKEIESNKKISPPVNKNCSFCIDLYQDLLLSIKTLNCKFEGIFIQKRNRLDFLSGSSLFTAIKNDLTFIHQKKLFYTKNCNSDRKIGEFLARWGISISCANEPYGSLDFQSKQLCNSTFGLVDKFVFKNGHDIEITALEHSFLILFYLYKEHDMHAYLCLEKRKLINSEKISKFYEKIVLLFKDSVQSAFKTGSLAVFRVKSDGFSSSQISILGSVLHKLLRIYLKFRKEEFYKICISFCSNEFLYSEDVVLEGNVRGLVKIEKGYFNEIIRGISERQSVN